MNKLLVYSIVGAAITSILIVVASVYYEEIFATPFLSVPTVLAIIFFFICFTISGLTYVASEEYRRINNSPEGYQVIPQFIA